MNESSGGASGTTSFSTSGDILVQYDNEGGTELTNAVSGLNDSELNRDFSGTANLAYINDLDSSKTTYSGIDKTDKRWDSTTRGLTETGTAVVVTAAVAATVLTAGAAGGAAAGATGGAAAATTASTAATIAATAKVAALSAAAATASTSAVNASMNADGDLFKQVKTVAKTTKDDTTSKESIKNIAISAAAAALTAGLSQGLDTATNGAVNAGKQAGSTLGQRATTALAESAVSNTASIAAESAINGDSFGDALKSQGGGILLGAVANLGAKEIGKAAKPSTTTNADGSITVEAAKISKPTQLALHAGLGCGVAAAGGADCGSGAVSGVVGELVGEMAYSELRGNALDKNDGYLTQEQIERNKDIAIELGGLAGGLSAIVTGGVQGHNDSEIAENIYSGSRIGKNAAENNALYFAGKYRFPAPGPDFDIHGGVQGNLAHWGKSIGTDGVGNSFDINPSIGAGFYINAVPRGEDVTSEIIFGLKNKASLNFLRTNNNMSGLGITFGYSKALLNTNFNVSTTNTNE